MEDSGDAMPTNKVLAKRQTSNLTTHEKQNRIPKGRRRVAEYINTLLFTGQPVVTEEAIKKSRDNLTDLGTAFNYIIFLAHSSRLANDSLKVFREELPGYQPVKLFAKHIKIDVQKNVLKKQANKNLVMVGTPNRILKLLSEGALNLTTKKVLLILDGRQTLKGYNLLTIKDLQTDSADVIRDIVQISGKILVYKPNVQLEGKSSHKN
jgi:hypothetical protein